jgi:uncharacterized protein
VNSFRVPFHSSHLKGDVFLSNISPLLFLHGAGKLTSRGCFHSLRLALDLPSVAFDFIGHGETGGDLESSSLEERLQQALCVIESLKLSTPLSIAASSMSAYTAIKLLEKYPVKNLILFVPAVYDVKAQTLPFNKGFTEIIRRHESWRGSDAWDILEKFQGNLLLICAEEDAVVPRVIPELIFQSAKVAPKKEIHFIPQSPHRILKFLSENPERFSEVVDRLSSFLKSCD